MSRVQMQVVMLSFTALLAPAGALAIQPSGIVYEAEAVSTPKTAWQVNKRSPDRWMLWTTEQDIEKKRSGKAVLAGPTVPADRKSPEQGAPPLHSIVTDLRPGVYFVYVSSPGRPLAYSLDGKEWFKHAGRELFLGTREITDGRFELWVDDRYAHPAENPGPGYYDYIRFVPVPASAQNVERHPVWHGLEHHLQKDNRGFVVPAYETADRVGFDRQGDSIKGQKPGHRFTYVFDRAGTFYLAVLMNDDADGTEKLLVCLNGKEVGCIIADQATDRPALFSFKQPLKVAKGDKLTFTCQNDVGYYRVHKLYFAAEPIVPPPPAFEHVTAWSTESNAVYLCWTTTTVVQTGVVEYGHNDLNQKTKQNTYRGRNHHVRLPKLDVTKPFRAKIVTEYQGRPLTSKVLRLGPARKSRPPTRPQTIELTIPEPTKHGRRNWPTTIGVPFAKGMLAYPDDLHLFDAQGEEVRLQADCFSRWADGGVKWATLTFLADTVAGDQPARYTLKAQPKWAKSAIGCWIARVGASEDAWYLTNHKIAFAVGKKTPGLLRHVEINRDGNIPLGVPIGDRPIVADIKLETGDGRILRCGPPDPDSFRPDSLKIEDCQPLRTMVSWSGPLVAANEPSAWRYHVRMTVWEGRRTIRLNVSVWNGEPTPKFRELKSLALRLPLERGGTVRGGFDGQPLQKVSDAEGLWILQDKDNHHRLRTSNGTTEGRRATGVAMAMNDRTRVTVFMRDFWQTYPSGFAVKNDGLHAQLLPPLTSDTYSDPDSQKWFYRLYAWFKDGKYLFRTGQLTQHDVYIRFDAPDSEDDALRFAAWMANPLLPQAPPAYLCNTAVLGRPIFPKTEGVWDRYEQFFDRGFQLTEKDRETRRTFGWMHYGDWFGERYLNYGNNEYDLAWTTALQWMRTGDRRYFDRGLQMARHHSTVDTLHGEFAAKQRCTIWTHCFNHLGTPLTTRQLKMLPDDKRAQAYLERFGGMLRGARDPQGHIYQQGNWLYAALTGDPWLHDVAERVCTHQAEKLTPSFNFSIERSGGWPLINAATAYSFTGNPYYLNAARIMVERCLQRQDPATGGWLHRPPVSETGGKPVLGGKAFAVGILTHALLRYLEQEPDDRPDVRHMLVRGADWLMNESWNPGKGFRYISNSPKQRDTGGRGTTCLLNAEVIAFAYEQTRDPKYLDFWREMMRGTFEAGNSGMGKTFSMNLRQTIFGLDRARHLGITSAPASSSPQRKGGQENPK